MGRLLPASSYRAAAQKREKKGVSSRGRTLCPLAFRGEVVASSLPRSRGALDSRRRSPVGWRAKERIMKSISAVVAIVLVGFLSASAQCAGTTAVNENAPTVHGTAPGPWTVTADRTASIDSTVQSIV